MSRRTSRPSHMRMTEKVQKPGGYSEPGGVLAQRLFMVAVGVLLLAPLVGMPFAGADASQEKRELAPAPQLIEDGRPNWGFLSDAGDFFADHFAFRSLMIDIDATLKQTIFQTSATSNVVVGKGGWLYYAGTLDDYHRSNTMSDHAIRNAVTNVSIMQEVVESRGKRFVFAVAPNKSTLFPEQMPYYELPGDGSSNYDRLLPQLQASGIHVVDLREPLLAGGPSLYYERDSHWNEEGALVAYRSITNALGGGRDTFEDGSVETTEHAGDVDGMLHPLFARSEQQVHRPATDAYAMLGDVKSVEDAYIVTNSSSATSHGNLLMYRDSFGNNLLGPFASSYQQAVFTKLVPYDMGEEMVGFAQDVVVERAERHLPFFASNPPYLMSPERAISSEGSPRSSATTLERSAEGSYLVVGGVIDASAAQESDRIFVELTDSQGTPHVYEAFHVSAFEGETADTADAQKDGAAAEVGDWGYRIYAPLGLYGEPESVRVRILIGDIASCTQIYGS